MNFLVCFKDGPAKPFALKLRRDPGFLRVVCNSAEEIGALDMVEDAPSQDEKVAVYRKIPGDHGKCLIDGTRNGQKQRVWHNNAVYELVPDQLPDDVVRDNEKWRAWCREQVSKEKAK